MKKQQDTRSQARILLDAVWAATNTATSHSWERLNHAMHTALRLAIGAGMQFATDDWSLSGYNAGRWVGETMEQYYRLAVLVGNRSAIETYEAWRKRRPIIADDVDLCGSQYSYGDDGRYLHGGRSTRKQERLAILCSFSYHGEQVEVTNFTDDGAAVCCSYKPQKKTAEGYNDGSRKILHRYTVTPESIKADRAEHKEKGKLLEELKAAVKADGAPKGIGKEIADFLAVPEAVDEARIFTLPLKKLQAAVEKFCPATNNNERENE